MSKKLDESQMQNELAQSAFFKPRAAESQSTPPPDLSVEPLSRPLEVGREGSREIAREVARGSGGVEQRTQPFDLNQKAYRKDSFLFTDQEFEAMEDLKLELRRKHDLDTTKQELGRCAVGYLIQDYREHQEDSAVVRILKAKKTYPKK